MDENQEKTGKKPATLRKPAKDCQKNKFSQKCTNFQLMLFAHFACRWLRFIILIGKCSLVDPRCRPQSLPVVITIFTHVVRPSICKSIKTKQVCRDCGLHIEFKFLSKRYSKIFATTKTDLREFLQISLPYDISLSHG